MPHLLDAALQKSLEQDREWLAHTELPIITVSGTFREDLKGMHGLPENDALPDIVLSRAHFSMAMGVATQAWQGKLDHRKAWVADPTNYVSPKEWKSVQLTEFVGKTLARHPLLKFLKDFVDTFGRNNLPILDGITPPLLYLTEKIGRPILCFHIAAGNILAAQGKQVVQVVTDPHVRPEYVAHANLPNIRYCVFDERTKMEFLETAAAHEIEVDAQRVIVTGPPVDPRITTFARAKKNSWRNGPLKLCIATGGLGTNKYEIRKLLLQLLPQLHHRPLELQLLVYAGTQKDIAQMARELAKQSGVQVGAEENSKANLRILYHPQILNANELLIHLGFPWADGFITKPSGDMAYDAAAAGCFLLTLQEWGVWEERIREIFEQKDIAHRADVDHIVQQLQVLRSTQSGTSWIERAMNHAFGIEKLFLLGSKKIVQTTKDQ
jgi:hypothetical protein